MKLRWKHFLVLLAASLVPLLAVTWITHNASRRLGNTISGKARNTLTDTVRQEMVRAARSYATSSFLGGFASEQCIQRLAARAELALVLPPPPETPLYYAADFDDPRTAPKDMALSKNHPIKFKGGVITYKHVSREHPNFLLAPGTNKADVAKDIARLTRLIATLKKLSKEYGEGLIWVYASLESGVHISYPGHGGYPADYDPRKRSWYENAKKSMALTWLTIIDATTRQLTLTVSVPFRHPDGSFAGVAAMDIKIAHALMENTTASSWSQKMSSFMIGTEKTTTSEGRKIWVLSSQEKSAPATSKSEEELSSQSPEIAALYHRIKNQKSGYLDMPFKGVDSLWAYAAMIADQYFVIVVPKSEIMTLPEEVGQMFVEYSKNRTAITGVAVVLALFLVGIVAFFTSRISTGHILTIIDAWKRLAKGDFSVRLQARMKDERAQLIQAFNEIVPKIEEHMRMSYALGLAQEVQQSLLPQSDPLLAGFDIAGASIYCDETGGDYYDFIETNRGGQAGLAVVVGDVSGHGVSSALLMATARALIMLRASMPGEAAGIISDVNRHLSLDTAKTGNFMTFFYSELAERGTQIRWVRAGHDPALVYDPSTDAFDELKGRGVPLGFDDSIEYDSFQRRLKPGQVIVIGTDGIWETHDKTGEMFGKEALMEIIRHNHKASARRIVNTVTEALEVFRGDEVPEDDITLVVIKVDR
ncbi:MAG: SpoIIE family protein phosphatase [Deltaproteobacteria bacterium]|jgi:sigma-B regulation protein RsbU (phosphoserine phosphatase)|nr:SpoIIE family protein phosphatase [Deltaproteobacteria bacterium]